MFWPMGKHHCTVFIHYFVSTFSIIQTETVYIIAAGFYTRLKFTIHIFWFSWFVARSCWLFPCSIWILYEIRFFTYFLCVYSSYRISSFVQQFQHHDIDLTSAVTTVSIGMTNLLIYCYFVKLASERLLLFEDV